MKESQTHEPGSQLVPMETMQRVLREGVAGASSSLIDIRFAFPFAIV